MKKYLSVLMLYIRGCFPGCLGSMLGLTIAQALEFANRGLTQPHLEAAFSRGVRFSAVAICIPWLSVLLCGAFCDRGGKMNLTLHRLSISERQGFWMQALCNGMIFGLYFLWQALVFLLFCFWFDPQVTGLEILVTSYDSSLFHQFLPLEDIWQIVTNCVLIIGLSVACAAYPMRQRHGMQSVTTFLMVAAAYIYMYLQAEGSHLDVGCSILAIAVTIFCIAVCLAGTMTLEVDDNDEKV